MSNFLRLCTYFKSYINRYEIKKKIGTYSGWYGVSNVNISVISPINRVRLISGI